MPRKRKEEGIFDKLKANENKISTFLGVVVVIVIGALVFNYFRSLNQEGQIESGTETDQEEQQEVILIEEEGKLVPQGLPTVYVVKENDNLWQIAEGFYNSGYNWVDIAEANNLSDADKIAVGQELTIPKTEVIALVGEEIKKGGIQEATNEIDESYQVAKGDSLWQVAVRAYGDGYRWTDIAEANDLENPGLIHPGNTLIVPR